MDLKNIYFKMEEAILVFGEMESIMACVNYFIAYNFNFKGIKNNYKSFQKIIILKN